jgi:hypothetical protein
VSDPQKKQGIDLERVESPNQNPEVTDVELDNTEVSFPASSPLSRGPQQFEINALCDVG